MAEEYRTPTTYPDSSDDNIAEDDILPVIEDRYVLIDGSMHEGGGQIVRTALAMSAITSLPCRIINIRKSRPEPGLKPQHLNCIIALEKLCNAKTEGADIGSDELIFIPGKIVPCNISLDIGTAGSLTLLLQSLLLPSLLSGGRMSLRITGGTDVSWSMPYDFFDNVLLPYYRIFGRIDCILERRGYYPKGNGKIALKIKSNQGVIDAMERFHSSAIEEEKKSSALISEIRNLFPPLKIRDRGKLQRIRGVSSASSDLRSAEVAERTAKSAKKHLSDFDCKVSVEIDYQETSSTGSGIILIAIFDGAVLGADALGKKGIRSESIGRFASNRLRKEIDSGASIDRHCADNIIPILGFLGGMIEVSEVTKHTMANIYAFESFFGKRFRIEGNEIFSE